MPLFDNALRILDFGAGDGYVSRCLLLQAVPGSQVVCFDPNYTDAHVATLRSVENQIFVRDLPSGQFSLILMLDVLEHDENDEDLLRGVVEESLIPGGVILISVPAWTTLFTMHDVVLGHYRRYHPSDIVQLVKNSRLRVIKRGGLFHSLLLPRLAQKAGEKLRGVRYIHFHGRSQGHSSVGVGSWSGGNFLTSILTEALCLDNAVSRLSERAGILLPGLTAWVLAQKP